MNWLLIRKCGMLTYWDLLPIDNNNNNNNIDVIQKRSF